MQTFRTPLIRVVGVMLALVALQSVARAEGTPPAPAKAPASHAIYVQAIPNEPNLNGNLVQVDLDGTHAQVIMECVSQVMPQRNAGILATRRTSRSGHDLLYLAPTGGKEGVKLGSALYFSDATLAPDGAHWAAITRPGLGMTWVVRTGDVGKPGSVQQAPTLPEDFTPRRIHWTGDQPVIVDDRTATAYELAGDAWRKLGAFTPPHLSSRLINKSETLDVKPASAEGHAGLEVLRVWFTGDRKVVATLRDCTLEDFWLVPGLRFALVAVRSDDVHQAYMVDLATGRVVKIVPRSSSPVQLRPAGTP